MKMKFAVLPAADPLRKAGLEYALPRGLKNAPLVPHVDLGDRLVVANPHLHDALVPGEERAVRAWLVQQLVWKRLYNLYVHST